MKTGAIVFLDILGFKGIWQHKPERDVLNLLLAIPGVVKKAYKEPPPESGWPTVGEPEVTLLSDTIIITCESQYPQVLLLMCAIINAILLNLLSYRMLARGAIGWGRYTKEGPIFLGPAVDDVAMWYEAANWVGVVTTPRTNYMIDRLENRKFHAHGKEVDPFVKYDVPLKSGKSAFLNVFNWPGLMQASYAEGTFRQNMTGVFSEQDSIDHSVHEKYENTLRFIDHVVKPNV